MKFTLMLQPTFAYSKRNTATADAAYAAFETQLAPQLAPLCGGETPDFDFVDYDGDQNGGELVGRVWVNTSTDYITEIENVLCALHLWQRNPGGTMQNGIWNVFVTLDTDIEPSITANQREAFAAFATVQRGNYGDVITDDPARAEVICYNPMQLVDALQLVKLASER